MMAVQQVNPTRMELRRLKKQLVTARRGHKLLKDKRDELMRQFMEKVRENMRLREEVEAQLQAAGDHFLIARSMMPEEAVATALLAPRQEVTLEVSSKNVMSVDIPLFEAKLRSDNPHDILCYGYAFTSSDLDDAVKALGETLDPLLRLAEAEKAAQLMAVEIEKTRRRVNALEHFMIPQLEETIKYIGMKLDENERGNTTRLMKVKDMMLEKAHHYQ